MKNIIVIFGTRPEVIKLAPVILELKKYPHLYNVVLCNTEQHKEMSNQALEIFGLKADISLDSMTNNQTLCQLQSKILFQLEKIFCEHFDLVIVQGDTMSVFAGALAGFYHKVPIAYVESGLRSNDLMEPFPEEAIRQCVSRIANIHFTPCWQNESNLLRENIRSHIYQVGNTSIDALSLISDDVNEKTLQFLNSLVGGDFLDNEIVLVTVHRRENHGKRLEVILNAIRDLAYRFSTHFFIIPIHPNPNVVLSFEVLKSIPNVILLEPLEYPQLVFVMKVAKLILTDSGGIQEEATAFGVPIIVLRYKTERMEGIEFGFAKLVGADYSKILEESSRILMQDKQSTRIDKTSPYGDGKASQRIEGYIKEFLNGQIG